MLAAAPLLLASAGVPAEAAGARIATTTAQPAAVKRLGLTVADFYAYRRDYPLWLSPQSGSAAQDLIRLLESSRSDGLDPANYGLPAIRSALAKAAKGDRKAILRADRMLSQAFVSYVADLRRDPGIGILYVEPQMRPGPVAARLLLDDVTRARSPSAYLAGWSWMNPLYAALRTAILDNRYSSAQKAQIAVNMDRARILPVTKSRYVLVNAAEQRLYMMEDGKPADDMRVVVGQVKWPTPMIVALIRFAALNPYWYVPPDLAWEDVGEPLTRYGQKYFDRMGYQLVSDWGPDAQVLDPKTIDWAKVRDGSQEVLIRQKPGPNNFMGRMKFMFPNEAGVYLHDNPRRELFDKDVRYFSGGCVRLSDAARLGRWLFGHDLVWQDKAPETLAMLDKPVPVYITYLTAKPQPNGEIAFFDDAYGRDAKALAGTADTPVHATDSAAGSPGGRR